MTTNAKKQSELTSTTITARFENGEFTKLNFRKLITNLGD